MTGDVSANFMSSMMARLFGQTGGLRHQIATAMTGTFILSLISKFLMFGTTVLLARLMGPKNYGTYASAIAIVTLVSIPASLGLPNLLVRELAAYRTREAWGLMKGLIWCSNQSVLLVSLLVMAILYAAQSQLETRFGFEAGILWAAFALLPLTLLSVMRMHSLRGFHHIVLGQVPESLVMPGIFIVVVLVLGAVIGTQLTPLEALISRLVAVTSAFAVGTFFLFAKLPSALRAAKPEYHLAKWILAAGPLMLVGAMNAITMQTDVVMLSALKGPIDAGIYQVAARAAELVAFVSAIINIALQPTLARLYAQGDLVKLKKVTRMAARIMFGSAFILAAIFISAGSDLLKLFYGVVYANGAIALGILSLGWTIVSLTGPARETLIMTGGEKAVAISIGVAAAVNVVLNLLLIPRYGTTGAALATATSLICCQIGYTFGVRYRLGCWISVA